MISLDTRDELLLLLPPGYTCRLIYAQARSNSPERFRRQSSSTCYAAVHAGLGGIGLCAAGAPGRQCAKHGKHQRKSVVSLAMRYPFSQSASGHIMGGQQPNE